MILENSILEEIKQKANLSFDKAKDFSILSDIIFKETNRMIGVTSLKRLFGYINDDRNTNEYTLNTIAIFLGSDSWHDYLKLRRIDSEWDYNDDAIYVQRLDVGTKISVCYLNRKIQFVVEEIEGENVLVVISSENSSLQKGDIAYINKIEIGEILQAEKVIRGESSGTYKTNGKITSVEISK